MTLAIVLSTVTAPDPTAAEAPRPVPQFAETAADAGLRHTYGGDTDFVVGGGVAAFDCNADKRPDLFLAGGAHPARLYVNASSADRLRFAATALPSQIPPDGLRRVTGAYPLDMDSDGRMDLFVMRFGTNIMLRGLGDCRFELANDRFGLPETADWTTAFAAIWEAGNRMPTLAVGNYVDRTRPLAKTGNCTASYILRPSSPTSARYGAPTELDPSACPLSLLFVDWRGNGQYDLRAANDRQYFDRGRAEQLWRLTADGPRLYSRDEGWAGPVIWGMGLAARDLDDDGRPEVAVTNMADNHLQALSNPTADRPHFVNRALVLNAMSQRPYAGGDTRPSTSWHVQFADLNNDAMADLWIVKGNVDTMAQFANFDPDSLLMGTAAGRFAEQGDAAGIALNTRGRGGAAVDLNGDGCLDLVTVNRNQPVSLFHNRDCPNRNAWLGVTLHQPGPNPDAVGALVSLRTVTPSGQVHRQTQDVTVGGGHAGGSAAPMHFGLGGAIWAEVQVRWPDGALTPWQQVRPGAVTAIRRRQ